jgi:hypothetical protein
MKLDGNLGPTEDGNHVPCDYGAFRDANIAANCYCLTLDPGPGSEREIGAKDHDIADDLLVNPEIGKHRGSPRISRRCSGDQQRKQKEKG